MRPEDVDAELVEKGMRAMGMWSKRRDLGEQAVRDVLAAVLPLDRLAQLEEMRAEVQGWRPCDTRDIGDAAGLADSVVDLIQDRIDSLTATNEPVDAYRTCTGCRAQTLGECLCTATTDRSVGGVLKGPTSLEESEVLMNLDGGPYFRLTEEPTDA